MFDINDNGTIMTLINARNNNELIIPVYVRIGNDYFLLTQINEIQTCNPSMFKIGFGSSDSVFMRNKFPKYRLIDFENSKVFKYFDEDKQCSIDYLLFESSGIDEDNDDVLNKEINKWCDVILSKIMDDVELKRKNRIKKIMEELS